jgi:hypothetical protein
MPDVIIKINPAQLEDITETLKGVAGGVGQAQSAAINRTMTHVRAVSAREIKKHINLPISRIKEAIDIKKRKARPTHPVGVVRFSHKPVPLIDYGARDNKPGGVSVTARKDLGTQVFRHAFIATMPAGKSAGHTGVFERIPGTWHRATRGKAKGRKVEQIKELFGPSVEGTFEKAPGVLAKVLADSGTFLAAQLASQVNRLLHRAKVDESDGGEE